MNEATCRETTTWVFQTADSQRDDYLYQFSSGGLLWMTATWVFPLPWCCILCGGGLVFPLCSGNFSFAPATRDG
ncbi:unnamed protein product [Cuscuta campestris]|uniref:Uncharacterized protein n=1 Tax=Cuscuta campestris TaxID=132261 RepID=A0A484NBJ3_9ASTE|nr:unnamed protein product [Cuscuta campestris]